MNSRLKKLAATSKKAGWILSHTCLYLKQLKTGGEVVIMLALQENGSLSLQTNL